jgi:hypothetical protein
MQGFAFDSEEDSDEERRNSYCSPQILPPSLPPSLQRSSSESYRSPSLAARGISCEFQRSSSSEFQRSPSLSSVRRKMMGGNLNDISEENEFREEVERQHYIQMRQDPIYVVCFVTAKIFQVFVIHVPDLCVGFVPNSGSLLSMAVLYLFAQALALLWGFLAVAVAVGSSRALQSLDEDTTNETCFAPHHMTWYVAAAGYVWRLVQVLARTYQLYASLCVWWFLSSSLFELGWEMYGDFPRMRRFLDANTYLPGPLRRRSSNHSFPSFSAQTSPAVLPRYARCRIPAAG